MTNPVRDLLFPGVLLSHFSFLMPSSQTLLMPPLLSSEYRAVFQQPTFAPAEFSKCSSSASLCSGLICNLPIAAVYNAELDTALKNSTPFIPIKVTHWNMQHSYIFHCPWLVNVIELCRSHPDFKRESITGINFLNCFCCGSFFQYWEKVLFQPHITKAVFPPHNQENNPVLKVSF